MFHVYVANATLKLLLTTGGEHRDLQTVQK